MTGHQESHSPLSVSQEARPCVLHTVHSPLTVVNELHHVFPMEYQVDVWGEVRNKTTVSVCSTGHNNVHAAIRAFDKTGQWPTWCRGKTRDLAEQAVTLRAAAQTEH